MPNLQNWMDFCAWAFALWKLCEGGQVFAREEDTYNQCQQKSAPVSKSHLPGNEVRANPKQGWPFTTGIVGWDSGLA